jgi:SAM-dependent methyltransferase
MKTAWLRAGAATPMESGVRLTFPLRCAYDAFMIADKNHAPAHGQQSTIHADTAQRHRAKYANRNPLHQFFLNRFFDAVAARVKDMAKTRVLEFGCGEGFFLQQLQVRGIFFDDLLGIDLRAGAVAEAQKRFPGYRFSQDDLFSLDPQKHRFDLVIASEVIEHLLEPEKFLDHLGRLCRGSMLVTVPWEPWFRLANLLRGRDISRLGNHPEHVGHYNKKKLAGMLSRSMQVVSLDSAFPFLIATATPAPAKP